MLDLTRLKMVAATSACLIVATALSGCGAAKVKPAPPVQLAVLSPADGLNVSASSITVSGKVDPRHAQVMVDGHAVSVAGDGGFSTRVALASGTNLIDVIAGAPHAHAAMTALRVVRYLLVRVPQVGGMGPKAAAAKIRAAGLVPKVGDESNPFSFLVPFSSEICGQSPSAGAQVRPGTTVRLSVGKVCL